MTDRIYSFLGLATKAGKLVSGDAACEKAIKSGSAALVIIAGDAAGNTRKKFIDMCDYREVNFRLFGEKELIGRYTGKEIRSVTAILDRGFTKRLMEMVDSNGL
jgi:ribosomal protein L7Ae-like RNA K-turn-binding protein